MNQNQTDLNIAELISTRISHDIIGNIGAVANAVELLEEGDLEFLDDIKSILKLSSGVLSARLKFFRMAFGASNANLSDLLGVDKICREYLATIGNQNFPIALSNKLTDSRWSKLALLGVMIAADTIIKGGSINIEQSGKSLYIIAQSNSLPPQEKITTLKAAIIEGSGENNAQFAPVFYLKELLKNMHYNIEIVEGGTFGMSITEG